MGVDYTEINNGTIAEFGIDAIYTPDGQAPRTLRGIFDYTYYEAEGSIGIQARRAVFTIEAVSAPAIKVDELIAVSGKTFTINQVHPDGYGLIELDLGEV